MVSNQRTVWETSRDVRIVPHDRLINVGDPFNRIMLKHMSLVRPLTTNCCAPKQAPGPSLQEPPKAGPGPSSGGDAFSALAMPPGPLPERCDRTTPMPLPPQP